MLPDEDLGEVGFDDADLLQTVRENLGVGIDQKLPPEGRFLLNVTRLVRRRLFTDPNGEAMPAVFFFRAGAAAPDEARRFEPLLHNGVQPVGSCLWFVGEMATNARGVEIDPWDDGPAFAWAVDHLQVGAWPAVVFDPRPEFPEVWFYANGLIDGDAAKPVPLDVSALGLGDIVDTVDDIHARFLATPTAQPSGGKLWEKSTKYWPADNAERTVQLELLIGLQMAYPTCDVREEREGVTGRVDLEIHAPRGAERYKTPAALLELKVLRSFRSTGSAVSANATKTWIHDGVIQAASYRDERKFPEAALCCFDMRVVLAGNACFAHVGELAQERDIVLKVWPIFNKAKSYREYLESTRR